MSSKAHSYSPIIHGAFDFAAQCHEGQMRKNKEQKIPYFSHCAAVARLLENAGYGPEVVAAGLLHDVVEDAKVSVKALKERFGEKVAQLVDWVSEQDKSLPWVERKQSYLDRLKEAPKEAKAISCADKTHNMWSLIFYKRAGYDPWSILNQDKGREGQLKRFARLGEILKDEVEQGLYALFTEALETLKQEC